MKANKESLEYTSLGITFAASVLLFWYLGTLIDAKFDTKYFQLIGIFLALIGMTYKLFLAVKKSNESKPH